MNRASAYNKQTASLYTHLEAGIPALRDTGCVRRERESRHQSTQSRHQSSWEASIYLAPSSRHAPSKHLSRYNSSEWAGIRGAGSSWHPVVCCWHGFVKLYAFVEQRSHDSPSSDEKEHIELTLAVMQAWLRGPVNLVEQAFDLRHPSQQNVSSRQWHAEF